MVNENDTNLESFNAIMKDVNEAFQKNPVLYPVLDTVGKFTIRFMQGNKRMYEVFSELTEEELIQLLIGFNMLTDWYGDFLDCISNYMTDESKN